MTTTSTLSSREFYDRQAAIYEAMNDWPARLSLELPFIRRALLAAGARSVLDVACGSGHHAIALAKEGYAVSAADASPEMLALARRNAAEEGVSIQFEPASLGDLGAAFAPGSMDAVLCLGNSLPHVLLEADLRAALSHIRGVLRQGGVAVLQNLNYDARWKNRPRFFAVNSSTIGGRTVLIWRMADYHPAGTSVPGLPAPSPEPGLITFHIATIEQDAAGAWHANVMSTLQRPLFAGEMRRWLAEAGFEDVTLYGGMDGSPFDAEASSDLVIVAK